MERLLHCLCVWLCTFDIWCASKYCLCIHWVDGAASTFNTSRFSAFCVSQTNKRPKKKKKKRETLEVSPCSLCRSLLYSVRMSPGLCGWIEIKEGGNKNTRQYGIIEWTPNTACIQKPSKEENGINAKCCNVPKKTNSRWCEQRNFSEKEIQIQNLRGSFYRLMKKANIFMPEIPWFYCSFVRSMAWTMCAVCIDWNTKEATHCIASTLCYFSWQNRKMKTTNKIKFMNWNRLENVQFRRHNNAMNSLAK